MAVKLDHPREMVWVVRKYPTQKEPLILEMADHLREVRCAFVDVPIPHPTSRMRLVSFVRTLLTREMASSTRLLPRV